MLSDTPAQMLRGFIYTAVPLLLAGLACGVVAVATGSEDARWLALHLAMLGGVSQLIVGVGQYFVCSFLATTPPARRLTIAQLTTWNVGVLLVVVSVPADLPGLTVVGALAILAGIGLYFAGLDDMRRRSLQTARWALRWYFAAGAALAAGVLLGVLLESSFAWTHGSLLGAHITLNVVGWLGTAIVGTLHTFFPTLTGTRLRIPRLQGATFWLWAVAVWTMAAAYAVGLPGLQYAALAVLTLAAGLLVVNLISSLAARTIPLSVAAVLISIGQCFLMLALLCGLASPGLDADAAFASPSLRFVAPPLAAWISLTVIGSLVHVIGVLLRVHRLRRRDPRLG